MNQRPVLDREEIDLLFSVVRKLTDRGLAVVFITHFLDQVFEISNRATVLRNGRVVGTRVLSEVSQTEIITMMLGRQLQAAKQERAKSERGASLLKLEKYGRRGTIEPFDLDLHEGEVVGLAGLLGSGRSETAHVIFGDISADKGKATLRGEPVKIDSPRAAIRLGFGLCPEDRKTDGIVGDLSVRENIILSLQGPPWLEPTDCPRQGGGNR